MPIRRRPGRVKYVSNDEHDTGQVPPPGEPRVPPGQHIVQEWPVLHEGAVPEVDLTSWDFRIFGLVEEEIRFTWDELMAMPKKTILTDIHCVTSWSRLGMSFEGIPVRAVLERVRPLPDAEYVMVHAEHGFTTNLPLKYLLADNVLLAYAADGKPLTPEHGWPLRLVLPRLYFWKSAKWVRGFEFMDQDRPGFWEQNGYHMRGDPWKEERYWF